jgi:hypothetical protein
MTVSYITVSYIKEFIDYEILKCAVINDKGNLYYNKIAIDNFLKKINSMLDELDRPKAKWEEQEYYKGYTAHQKANICSKCGFETVEKTNYCSNCGAKMNDELEENNK